MPWFRPLLSLALAGPLLGGSAWAGAVENAAQLSSVAQLAGTPPGPGLTVAVAFGADFVDERPTEVALVQGEQELAIALRDDGQAPDLAADDGVAVAFFPDAAPGAQVRVRLVMPTGEEYFSDTIPVVAGSATPGIGLVLTGSRLRVLVAAGGAGPMMEGDGGPPPPPAGMGPPEDDGGPDAELLPIGVLGGLAVGGALGWVVGRRRRTRDLVLLDPPAPWPPGLGAGAAGRVDLRVAEADADAVLKAVVALMGQRRPVLVAGARAGADWAGARALGLAADRPSAEELVEAAQALAVFGRPLVVVPGAAAIEEPAEDEDLGNVLDDIPALSKGAVDVLCLRPDAGLVVALVDGRLVDGDGRPLDPNPGAAPPDPGPPAQNTA